MNSYEQTPTESQMKKTIVLNKQLSDYFNNVFPCSKLFHYPQIREIEKRKNKEEVVTEQ